MRITLREGVMYAYCVKHNISRDELARRLGVATTTAFRVEKGDVDPSPRFIAAFLHLTGEKFESVFQIISASNAA